MHGDIVAAIGVSAPVDRLPRNEINKIAEQVRATADTLSKQLGYLPPSAHRTA
jgi:DNA-binding IclR family transcriptional regulator